MEADLSRVDWNLASTVSLLTTGAETLRFAVWKMGTTIVPLAGSPGT